MPQAITFLGVDSALEDAPDWGTICVYTCSASCATLADLPSHGGLDDPPPVGGDGESGAVSAAAAAAVGLRCVLAGLIGRADLNGSFCEVLYWHTDSGRWAIQIDGGPTGGEKLRVRSNNLRVVRPADAVEWTREGGYAEEYVHVQPH